MNSQAISPIELSVEQRSSLLQFDQIRGAISKFTEWLEYYGETSYDFQSYYASRFGQTAKMLYYKKPLLGIFAVAPMVFSEAFMPSARRIFWKRQRFPIADAHYAMGFALLAKLTKKDSYYQKALHFIQVLKSTRCSGYSHYCWGYPFDWETLRGTIREGTPLITTVPYVYEAFRQVWEIDRADEWLKIMNSIAEHALEDYKDFPTSPSASTCSYTPDPAQSVGVVNANAYRAFLLMSAAHDFSEQKFRTVAERNLNFVIESQKEDGSWPYAKDGKRNFIDHFHTCFVLKALVKIEALGGHPGCTEAIKRGVSYYTKNLFDEQGLPKPFSSRPRFTVYRRELYDYAECINLASLLQGRFPTLDGCLPTVLNDILTGWQKPDGSFRSRRLLMGWDNTPMHRWAQAQLFRSLCLLLYRHAEIAKSQGTIDPA
ncbi:MAG: hypothetical protein WA715_09830 [Candidatus Acidiferrum sp.]